MLRGTRTQETDRRTQRRSRNAAAEQKLIAARQNPKCRSHKEESAWRNQVRLNRQVEAVMRIDSEEKKTKHTHTHTTLLALEPVADHINKIISQD